MKKSMTLTFFAFVLFSKTQEIETFKKIYFPLIEQTKQNISEEIEEIKMPKNLEKRWSDYLYGKKKPTPTHEKNENKNEKNIYWCTAFVQKQMIDYYGMEECKNAGIIKGNGEKIGGTWDLLNILRNNGSVVWEKEEKSSEIAKKAKEKKINLTELLAATNTREAEKFLEEGDIIFAWYPQSLFKHHYVTHSCIYIGEKEGKKYILQEWGRKVEVLELEKLYKRTPGGIDAIARPFRKIKLSEDINA